MNLKKLGFYLVAAVFIFAGQFLVNQDLISGKPPAMNQTTLSGDMPLLSPRKGPMILYFWAEWCGVCRSMQSSISHVLQDYPGTTIAVQSGDDDKLRAYLNQKQLIWPVVNDHDGNVAQHYGVKAVPALFFINTAGNIVFSSAGFTSEWGIRFRLWLTALS